MDLVSANELCDVLVAFLNRFSYCEEVDTCLSQNEFQSINDFASSIFPEDKRLAYAMSEYSHYTYPFLPLEIRKAHAVYNTYQMAVDDMAEEEKDSLKDLSCQLSSQKAIQHPLWNRFFIFLPQLLQFYGPYIQTTLFRGALEYIQATYLERTLFKGYPGSRYPEYIRRMSCQAPAQAASCFPEAEFPQKKYLSVIASMEAELEHFVGAVNDLFSFYKESKTAMDRINYPLNLSSCSGRAPLEILYELVEVSISCWGRVQAILDLKGEEKLSQRMREFFRGYVRYHLACDRYQIASLCGESRNKELLAFYNTSRKAVGLSLAPVLL